MDTNCKNKLRYPMPGLEEIDSDLRELTYSVPLGRTECNIDDHRRRLDMLRPVIQPDDSVAKIDLYLPITPTRKIHALMYRPKTNPYANKIPTLIYVAGTAFVAHETAYTDVACTHIAARTGCQVMVIQHRLAPEETFPAQTDDVTQASEYLFNNATKFKIDLDRVATLGYSTGGTFIAQLGAKAQENNWPIALQILVSPVLDLARTIKEFEKFEEQDTVISNEFVEWFLKLYVPSEIEPTDPRISPYHMIDVEKMPPTSIIVGQFDRFRGDAEKFAQKLGDNCISFIVHPNQNHAFFKDSIEAFELVATAIKTTFGLFSIIRDIDIDSTTGDRKGYSVVTTNNVSTVDDSRSPPVSTLSLNLHANGEARVVYSPTPTPLPALQLGDDENVSDPNLPKRPESPNPAFPEMSS
jgi:acetyl esterase/lipase